MPREKEYNSAADRQRAYRERKAQRAALPPLPAVVRQRLQTEAVDALAALEQLLRDDDASTMTIHEVMDIRDSINKLPI
jgi:hypothetical protein